MRRTVAALTVAAFVVTACGDSGLSAEEYFPAVEEAAIAYDQTVGEINDTYTESLDQTIADFAASGASPEDEAAMGELAGRAAGEAVVALGETGIALEQYQSAVAALTPPSEAQVEHDELLASMEAALAAVRPTVELLAAVSSVDDLGPAVAGSPFFDTRARLESSCLALQDAGAVVGAVVDLRCVRTDEAATDAP
jgi:hypothetical protein